MSNPSNKPILFNVNLNLNVSFYHFTLNFCHSKQIILTANLFSENKMQLDDYKALIEQLLPVYGSEDFQQVFDSLTSSESGPIKLHIKMEINRLMTPCKKIIDLRGRVKGQCRPYTFNDQTHWLDDVAINILHRRSKVFNNQYCTGLYEALVNTHNDFRELHQQGERSTLVTQKSNPELFTANLIRFGHYLHREENRLQISTPVTINFPLNQQIWGMTADLSFSGAKFKVPAAFNYRLGQTIDATFPQLATTHDEPCFEQPHRYRILGIDDNPEDNSFKWLRLIALSDNEALKTMIVESQNKGSLRHRHNHEDKIIQARTQGYEHCFLKHTVGIPLFFSGTELKYALLTDHNRYLWQYWHDERNQPVINQLLSEQRIASLGRKGLKQSSTLIYCFHHDHQGSRYFYSAALPEMDQEQRRLFWQLGAHRDSWRVMRLTVYPLRQQELEKLNDVAPEMLEKFQDLTHVGVLQDITHKATQPDYRAAHKSSLDSKAINPFRHPKNPICLAEAIHFDPKPQRSESRFAYKTPISLYQQGQLISAGHSIDFSSKGLNINLDTPFRCKKDDPVIIKFDQLQRLAKIDILSRMPYRVIRTSPNGKNIQLITEGSKESAAGEQFLRNLIKSNQEKLALCEEQLSSPAMLLAMHQMLLTRLNSIPYFAEKIDHKIKVKTVGSNFPLTPLADIFYQLGEHKHFDLSLLFKRRVKEMLAYPMRPIENVREPYVHELYIAFQQQDGEIKKIAVKASYEFETLEDRIRFITFARKNGSFLAIRVTALPIFNPLTALIGEKLSELARLTLHRARALEAEFISLIGCGEIFDITDEVLVRLEIS